MTDHRPVHPDFQFFLDLKDQALIELYIDLRQMILDMFPDCNELLYHTHALTSVFSISEKSSDGFCMIPIYTQHFNLGFQRGTLLNDPHQLLQGTGKLMRHIPVNAKTDYRNAKVKALIQIAADFAIADMDKPSKSKGKTISKIKR